MKLTRREFLNVSLGTSGLVAFSPAVPAFLSRSAWATTAESPSRDTVLVLIQLSGGNDGLNTVIPFEDDTYHRERPTLRLAPNQVLSVSSLLGFHPEMEAFHRLYQDGLLTIAQGVGYPHSNRDHDQAMRDWHTAQPGESPCQTGWAGRTIDHAYRSGQTDLPGIFVGSIQPPFGLRTQNAVVPALGSLGDWPRCPSVESGDETGLLGGADQAEGPLLPFLQRATIRACSASRLLQAWAQDARPAGPVDYPSLPLAHHLQTIARLVRADLGIRIFFAELGGGGIGGFDSHANQKANHGALLRQLSESVAAFVADLQRDRLLSRVLVMTFSEFGRTVAENGRRGTDHGAAAPMLLVGGPVRGGLVGPHPSLLDLEGGALKYHTDFRRVYATVLDRWLGIDSRVILGDAFPALGLWTS